MFEKKKPAYKVFVVEDIDDETSYWTNIGVAFAHEDQRGMNLILKALPLDGRLVLRRYTEATGDKWSEQTTPKESAKTVTLNKKPIKSS